MCGRIAAHSASMSRSRMRPSYQPEVSTRLYFLSSGPSSAEVLGNWKLISVPANPACRVSDRMVSSEVPAPSEGRSSLTQVMGLMARRTDMRTPGEVGKGAGGGSGIRQHVEFLRIDLLHVAQLRLVARQA